MSDLLPFAVFLHNNPEEHKFWQKQSKELPIDLYFIDTPSPSDHFAEIKEDQITGELISLYDFCVISHKHPTPIAMQDKLNGTRIYSLDLENKLLISPIEEINESLRVLAILNDLKIINKKGKELPIIGIPILAIELLTKTVCLQCPEDLEEKLLTGHTMTTNHKAFSEAIPQFEFLDSDSAEILYTAEKYPYRVILAPKDLKIIAIIKGDIDEKKCNFEIKKLLKGTGFVFGQIAEISFHYKANAQEACLTLTESFDGLDVKSEEISPQLSENPLELLKIQGLSPSFIQAERINDTIALILLKKNEV